MDKKERKHLEEKITTAVSETVKTDGKQLSSTFLKNVKKHAKAIAKKLLKETALSVLKTTATKRKKAPLKKAASPKKSPVLTAKKATAAKKK